MTDLTVVMHHYVRQFFESKFVSIKGLELGRFVASIGVTNNKFKKWHSTFWENLETSINLHKINKLIVLNHNDCGAAKIVNKNKKFNSRIENVIHKKSFNKLKKTLKKKFPKIKVTFKILSLKNAL